MKNILIVSILLPSTLFSQEIPLNDFTDLSMNQGFSYIVQAADKNAIIVDNLPSDFQYEQSGDKVSIGIDKISSKNPTSSGAKVTILTKQPLSRITTTTYANVTMESDTCNSDQFSVESNTYSKLWMKGNTEKLHLSVSTGAQLEASESFTANEADMLVSTSARANLPFVKQSGHLNCNTSGTCVVKSGSNLSIEKFFAEVITK